MTITIISIPDRFDNGQYAPRNWDPVESSNLEAVSWVPTHTDKDGVRLGRLYVEFKSGDIYRYSDVPEGDADAIVSSDSPGGTLYEQIKLAGYSYQQVA
jgi:hypothetical protein